MRKMVRKWTFVKVENIKFKGEFSKDVNTSFELKILIILFILLILDFHEEIRSLQTLLEKLKGKRFIKES